MTRDTYPTDRDVTVVTDENAASLVQLPFDQFDEIVPGCRTWTTYEDGRPIGQMTVWPDGRAAADWGSDSSWGEWSDGLFFADSGETYNSNGQEVSGGRGRVECTHCKQVIARGDLLRRCDADGQIYCDRCLTMLRDTVRLHSPMPSAVKDNLTPGCSIHTSPSGDFMLAVWPTDKAIIFDHNETFFRGTWLYAEDLLLEEDGQLVNIDGQDIATGSQTCAGCDKIIARGEPIVIGDYGAKHLHCAEGQ